MKVHIVLLIIVFGFTTNIFPQVHFATHTVAIDPGTTFSVYAVDIDSDGDMDVLSASLNDDKIAWYENDGNENFTPHTITTNASWANSVYAVDLDGDDDMDVLSASILDNKIAWYENDGSENFTPHTITTSAGILVYAVDVDGDGDIDVLSSFERGYPNFESEIFWYENLLIVGLEDNNSLSAPVQFQLFNNYPNPFNPSTSINYQIPELSFVTLNVYDVLGNEVATLVNEEKSAGSYEIEFNAINLSAGFISINFEQEVS